jgi:hypothetical protein
MSSISTAKADVMKVLNLLGISDFYHKLCRLHAALVVGDSLSLTCTT